MSKSVDETIAERGKIVPRRISGVCAPHQRRLTDAIFKARNIALLKIAAGLGLALQPEFIVWEDIQAGRLEAVMCDWVLGSVRSAVMMGC